MTLYKKNGIIPKYCYKRMDEFEDELMNNLPDEDGHINIGRETADSMRTIYFACREFRKAFNVTGLLIEKYKYKLRIDFQICKDIYWMTFDKFI